MVNDSLVPLVPSRSWIVVPTSPKTHETKRYGKGASMSSVAQAWKGPTP